VTQDAEIVRRHTLEMWGLGYFKESGIHASDLFPFDDEESPDGEVER
jgi:hypothetical protein